MPTIIDVQEEDAVAPMSLLDLEDEVRSGRLSIHTLVRHADWGEDFRPIHQIAELAEATDAPAARMAEHFRHGRWPWLTTLVSMLVLAVAAVQVMAMLSGTLDLWALEQTGDSDLALEVATRAGWLQTVADAWMEHGVLDGVIAWLDGRWHTPWTWTFTHAGLGHAVVNVGLLAYCGARVERALGAGTTALMLVGSWWMGSIAVLWLSDLPVAGSSVLTYGAWGAMVAIGVRYEDSIPTRYLGPYHLLNLGLFVPLWLSSLQSPMVSHAAHFGGLLGGVLVVLIAPANHAAPSAEERAHTLRGLMSAMALLAALPSLAALGAVRPEWVYQPTTAHHIEQANVDVDLPRGFAEHEGTYRGYPSFWPRGTDVMPLSIGLVRRSAPTLPTDEDLDDWWDKDFATLERLDDPAPLFEGDQPAAWVARDPEQQGEWVLLEQHTLTRGIWGLRAFWISRATEDGTPIGGRTRLYRQTIASLEIGDPPKLAEQRRAYERNPKSPLGQYELAVEEVRAGFGEEADARLAPLVGGTDGLAWDAARARLQAWSWYPELMGEVAWLSPFLAEAPWYDRGVVDPGIRVLVLQGACEAAREAYARTREASAGEPVEDRGWVGDLGDVVEACGS